jgi:hypothetical protein
MIFARPATVPQIFSNKISYLCLALGILLFIILTFLPGLPGYAEERGIREYPVPGHGILHLNVPKSWKDEVQEPEENRPLTITFRPGIGNEFVMMITPLWNSEEENLFGSEDKIRALVEDDWKAFSKKAKEPKPKLHQISGTGSDGFYYTATDKAPKKGEYKYLLRAGIKVGDLLLSVTLLSHKKDSQAIKDGLHLLKEARQKSD